MSKTDTCPKAATIEKSALAEQSIDYQAVLAGFNVRVTSKKEVDYSTVKGWFMDLYRNGSGTITGERVVS